MDQEGGSLTQHCLQQAAELFRERCYAHPPVLRELFEEVVHIARKVSETLSPEQTLLLLQEHPEWVQLEAGCPGRQSIATIVAEHLAYLIRSYINTQWAVLLLNQKGRSC